MKKKGDIEETLRFVRHDLKAEVILADLIGNGLEYNDFVMIPNGSFRRRYSHDIAYAGPLKLQNGQEPVGIYINRDAVYDILPEGFFHEKTESRGHGSANASKGSKKLKAEEKAARNFFLPFENELFWQRINLELEERNILFHFSENILEHITPGFWGFDTATDSTYLSRMVKFLHFSYKITGDVTLTGKCLGLILNEEVTASLVEKDMALKENKNGQRNSCCSLGSTTLGAGFVCGDTMDSTDYLLHFAIGPLKNSRVADYLEGGTIAGFIECFTGYFVPAELDVLSTVLAAPADFGFTLGDYENGSVLGYTSVIE
jgi:hypothetical protein